MSEVLSPLGYCRPSKSGPMEPYTRRAAQVLSR